MKTAILKDEISHYQAQGSVLICGDLNARTGIETDSVTSEGDKHIPGQISIPLPPHPHRNNFDKTVNKSRNRLLLLCQTLHLYVDNSRL